ncbi:MAG: hypothetical protein EP330_12565 [Deltaproteobacteria bacterium]|nr:MAG: hypothetical protein EP330_12565 [Deltaproteobacteria bacterium]
MNEPLPDLQDAMLDRATLHQLVADLEQHARVLEVRTKGGQARRADAAPMDLRDALHALETGAVFGVQVRYLYEGAEWRDTLMRLPEGVRLVRMQMPELP